MQFTRFGKPKNLNLGLQAKISSSVLGASYLGIQCQVETFFLSQNIFRWASWMKKENFALLCQLGTGAGMGATLSLYQPYVVFFPLFVASFKKKLHSTAG